MEPNAICGFASVCGGVRFSITSALPAASSLPNSCKSKSSDCRFGCGVGAEELPIGFDRRRHVGAGGWIVPDRRDTQVRLVVSCQCAAWAWHRHGLPNAHRLGFRRFPSFGDRRNRCSPGETAIIAKPIFIAGPAAATSTIPIRGLRSARKLIGTGLAYPNKNGDRARSKSPGRRIVPNGSMCRNGLRLTRPSCDAVSSPRKRAT